MFDKPDLSATRVVRQRSRVTRDAAGGCRSARRSLPVAPHIRFRRIRSDNDLPDTEKVNAVRHDRRGSQRRGYRQLVDGDIPMSLSHWFESDGGHLHLPTLPVLSGIGPV